MRPAGCGDERYRRRAQPWAYRVLGAAAPGARAPRGRGADGAGPPGAVRGTGGPPRSGRTGSGRVAGLSGPVRPRGRRPGPFSAPPAGGGRVDPGRPGADAPGGGAAAAALRQRARPAARLRDQGRQQPRVPVHLGVPLHAEREPPVGVLQRLHRAVVRTGGRDQARAEAVDGLVVVRRHLQGAGQQSADARARDGGDAVAPEHADDGVVVLVADPVRQVLDQGAARVHVHQLHAPADAQHRDGAGQRRREDAQFPPVPHGHRGVGAGMPFGAVQGGVEVLAAGQDDSVQPGDDARGGRRVVRGQQDGPGSRVLDGTDVGGGQHGGGQVPCAPGRVGEVGGDADERCVHVDPLEGALHARR